MLIYLYLGAYFAAILVNNISVKKNSSEMRAGTADRPVFIIITGIIACIFFASMSHFSLHINGVTWLYALSYAVIVLCSLVTELAIFRYAKIPTVSVIRSTCSLTVTSVTGTLLFSEHFSPVNFLRIALLIVASVLIYISQIRANPPQKNENEKKNNQNHVVFFLLMAFFVLIGTASTLVTKSFALRTDVSDANSYYFATNLILIVLGLIWLLFTGRGNLRGTLRGLREIRPVNYLFIVVQTVSSNLASLSALPLVGMLAVASYSAYTSAIGVTASAVTSLFFREKQDRYSVIAILIAVTSFLIGVFAV